MTAKEKKRAYNRAYRAAHLESVRAGCRTWYAANRERVLAYNRSRSEQNRVKCRVWRAANLEKARAIDKAYRTANSAQRCAYNRAYHAAHLEQCHAGSKAWRTANSEKIRARKRAARVANLAKFRDRERAYKAANTAKVRAYAKTYYQVYRRMHPEVIRACHQRRRARLANALRVEYADAAIFARDKWQCQIPDCSFPTRRIDKRLRHPDPASASLDHIIPISKGGADAPWNVQTAHLRCNLAKGARATAGQAALAL